MLFLPCFSIKYSGKTMIPVKATEKRHLNKNKIRTSTLLSFLSCAQPPMIILKREKIILC